MTAVGAGIPLAQLTTLRVGGPARAMSEVADADELVATVLAADRAGDQVMLLGGGSNVVVADDGVDALVIRIRTTGRTVRQAGDDAEVTVAAGEPWDDVVEWTVGEGWSGLETLSGIPGSCGATPFQNVGAYGREISQVVTTVRVLDRLTGTIADLDAAGCGFAYRDSVFRRHRDRYVILAATFRLRRDRLGDDVRYAELATALAIAVGQRAPAPDVRQAVLELRRGKAMVLDPADHDTWSVGSFFTNPVLAPAAAARLPAAAPRYRQPDGSTKTSAAWLIEQAGFPRGYGTGRARLSTRHSLAITNRGGATAAEVLALARELRDGVRRTFAVDLQPEPILVGCSL
ncbi:MAG: UDP-N-acetylmuramate dehydrogenase [Actinomycetota bacterium]|nr:MAG: UDP-N-acetylmuramate dehydrogenase [Actinomycetota bacterium]